MVHGERLIPMKVLIVDDEITMQTANGRATCALTQELRDRDVVVTESITADDGQAVVLSDPSVEAILLDWTLSDDDAEHDKAKALIDIIRTRNAHVPIFLMAKRGVGPSITAAVMRKVDELIWILEDTTFFIAGRILAAMKRYRDQMAPPFTKALIAFAQVYEYSWHMPGHTGGTAFLKSPIGRVFYQYFGENRHAVANGDWSFSTWNADLVTDPATGQRGAFEDAPDELLIGEPDCWVLRPGEAWHGFKDIEDGYCMLDPIKVSVVTPGVAAGGSFEKMGIPATLVTAYLDQRGIVVEKTTDFTILFLFSMGVTKGKYGTLINALLRFKEDYDANAPLSEVLTAIVAAAPARYAGMGLRQLADEMFDQMKVTDQLHVQAAAFSTLPVPAMTPADAYSKLVHDEVELVAVDQMANRIVATGVVPYPPGIPMLMPGEYVGGDDSPYRKYLLALQAWDRRFPGFGHDTHGVEIDNGTYYVYCQKEGA